MARPLTDETQEIEALRLVLLEAECFLADVESHSNLATEFEDSIRRLSDAITKAKIKCVDEELKRFTFWQAKLPKD